MTYREDCTGCAYVAFGRKCFPCVECSRLYADMFKAVD